MKSNLKSMGEMQVKTNHQNRNPDGTYLDTTKIPAKQFGALWQPIIIGNKGGDIRSTNYFDNPLATAGLFFLSGNAGTARLLIPDNMIHTVAEMQTGEICVLTSGIYEGSPSIEIMFEDHASAPFTIFMSQQQSDFRVRNSQVPFKLTAWTRSGKVGEWEAYERIGRFLPCRLPWI